jgi:hypothetical protein
MRRLLASTFVAAGAAALLATGAVAQMNSGTRAGSGMIHDQTGTVAKPFETITSIDPTANRIVVRNAAGVQRVVVLDSATGIERQGPVGASATPMRVSELAVGDRIVVVGSGRQGGFTAQRIEVLPGGAVGAPPSGMTPNANPAGPPGTMRPGAPNPTGGAPNNPTGGAPSNPTGGTGTGGMGGTGAGGGGGQP